MTTTETTTDRPAREFVGRVHHVVLAYADRASRDRAREEFREVLGVDDWDDLGETGGGVEVLVSWGSSLELISPTREGSVAAAQLATRGEGLFCLVFGVDDADLERQRVRALGRPAVPLPAAPDGVLARFDVANEVGLGQVGGLSVLFGEFVRKDLPYSG